MSQLTLGELVRPRQMWNHIPVEDPRASKIYDRHYSRQTEGAEGVLAPGQRFLLWHEGIEWSTYGAALWGVVRNCFRDKWRWRNSIFRNESGTLSSTLIREATASTFAMWARRYGSIPSEPLITEIDIEATRKRRGKSRPPGYCYIQAGWIPLGVIPAGHGRSMKAILKAPGHV